MLEFEAQGRLKMTQKCHLILAGSLESGSINYGGSFIQKEKDFNDWVAIWQKEQQKNQQLETLLGDGVDIDHEIRNLEKMLELEQRKNAAAKSSKLIK